MSKSINVQIDLSGMDKKISAESFLRGQVAMAHQMAADMDQFVPYREGTLSSGSVVSPDGSHIDYVAPYARAQFYGVVNGSRVRNYTTSTHSNAGRRWDLRAKARYSENWKKAFVKGAGID